MTPRRLILLGGGHAHVHVLARAARRPLDRVELVLVSNDDRQLYSGMVPGHLHGAYREDELAIDLGALAAHAGARFLRATAERIDAPGRRIETDRGTLDFDWLSLDVGSTAAGLDLPGVREHALAVRPMSRVRALRERAESIFAGATREPAIAVVGGGAAGIEVALALERRARARGARAAVTLYEAGRDLWPGAAERPRRLARRALAAHDVAVETGRAVTAVDSGGVTLAGGETRPAELVVWLAGAAPPALLADSPLPRDERGFLLVDASLRAVDGSPIFGAGDCVGIAGHPRLPKAGVYAVREAPVLDHNLRAALAGRPPRGYRPQASFLALLNTADGRAIWRWQGLSGHSRAAWRLKDTIDRRFVGQYRESR